MATTDLHMHILPYDYLSDNRVDQWGLANTACLIHAARQQVPNSILLDNGDFLHGTAMGDLVLERAGLDDAPAIDVATHPMIAAMNHLDYDAANLGNHDFDRGVDVLLGAIGQASFPVLSANSVLRRAACPTQDTTLMPPFTILHRKVTDTGGAVRDLGIGVLGLLPPGSLRQGSGQDNLPETRDIVETARAYVPLMRQNGADIVIVLAHSGLGGSAHVPNMENALVPLSRLDGIDAIVGGHTHQVFPAGDHAAHGPNSTEGRLNGIPTVMPGFWGSHLGIVDLDLTHQDGRWQVSSAKVDLRAVTGADRTPANSVVKTPSTLRKLHTPPTPASAPDLPTLLDGLHEKTLSHMRTRVGHSLEDLDTYLALVGADNATRLVQVAMADYAHQIQQDMAGEVLPVLASSAPFKSGGLGGANYYSDVPAGDITLRSVSDLYIFPNELILVRATGAYLKDWLERSVSIYNQVLPGDRRVALKEDATPGYLLEAVFGLTYQVDLSQPARFTPAGAASGLAAGRIIDLCHNAQAVHDDDEFLLATSDFRARGGGGFPVAPADRIMPTPPIAIRDVLKAFVERNEVIEVSPAPIWRFANVPGASIMFKSSPRAATAVQKYPWLSIDCVTARDAKGFAHYEMEL